MRRIPDHFHAHARDPAWPGFAASPAYRLRQ
jgi:hypothetical protein